MEESFRLIDVQEVPLWKRFWNGHYTHLTHYTTMVIPPYLHDTIGANEMRLPLYDRWEDLQNGEWQIEIPLQAFGDKSKFSLAQLRPTLTRID